MKSIEIPDDLYSRLEAHVSFTHNTPAKIIEKWADIVEQQAPHLRGEPLEKGHRMVATEEKIRRFDPSAPPNLAHTRAWGRFGTAAFRKWNDLVRVAHIEALDKLGSFEALVQLSHAKLKKGEYIGEGYKPVGNRGFSIQNVDALHAWQYSFALAKHFNVPIQVNLEWLDKADAQFPGEKGLLAWSPP